MTARNPLVNIAGDTKELPAGDSLVVAGLGVGTSVPEASIHILSGTEVIAPSTLADDFVIENDSSAVGISLLTHYNQSAYIMFGSDSDADVQYIRSYKNTNSIYFATNTVERFTMDGAGDFTATGKFIGADLKLTGGGGIYPSADSTTALYINKADNATHVLTIDTTNVRLGVGTTPKSTLHVNGNQTIGANAYLGSNIYYNSGWKYVANGYAGGIKFESTGGAIEFYTAPSNAGGADAAATFAAKMLLTNAGSLGIGVTPAADSKLHVYDATNSHYLYLETDKVDGATGIQFLNDAVQWSATVATTDQFIIRDVTNNINPLVITKATGVATFSSKLGLLGSAATYPISILDVNSNDLYTARVMTWTNASGDSFGGSFYRYQTGGGNTGKLVGLSGGAGGYGIGAGNTLANAIGVSGEVNAGGNGGTITNGYALYARNGDIFAGGGTITNKYGLYIETITGGTGLNYSIYTGTAPSVLGGNVSIAGQLTSTKALADSSALANAKLVLYDNATNWVGQGVDGTGSWWLRNAGSNVATFSQTGVFTAPTVSGTTVSGGTVTASGQFKSTKALADSSASANAKMLTYYISDTNWSGFGNDSGGNFWLKTGLASSYVWGFSVGGVLTTPGKIQLYDANSYIDEDAGSNLVFKDANNTTRSLKDLSSGLLLYGDGSDGDYTLDASQAAVAGLFGKSGTTFTLLRDVFADDLTIATGYTLNPNGYRIFCTGTLTTTGNISADGGAGGNGGNGSAGGGTAGVVAHGAGSLPASIAGQAGGGGGDSGFENTAGTNGTNVTNGERTATAGAAGGNGGAGSLDGAKAGGLTGTMTNITTGVRNYHSLSDMAYLTTTGYGRWQGNSGSGSGGGGGSDGTNNAGAGGGSGANGGHVVIIGKKIIGAGYIYARGGNGGNGGNAVAGDCGGGGGGGGGNGGVIIVISSDATFNSDVSAGTGGTAGAKTGLGVAGSAGQNGMPGILIQLDLA